MRKRIARSLPALAAGMFVTACSDRTTAPPGPDLLSARMAAESRFQLIDRKDTPFARMTDAEFAQAVEKSNGRVLIGLKDSTAVEGVSNDGRVLVTGARLSRARLAVQAVGAKVEYVFRATPVVVATADVKAAVLLRRHPNVDYIEPETRGEWASQVTPWGITRIGAPAAWSLSTGAGIKLLIMDSGIMEGHPDLALGVRWRCINGSLPIGDVVGHGTHVGGTAGALNNATFVVGGSPAVSLWSANVEISGDPVSSEVACSTEVARLNGVHVVNMSFGLMPSTAVTDQIRIGYNSANMLFVASAGNTFGGAVTYPASLSEVIAVTATDINNARASFAARGAKLELAAPGVEILSTSLPTGYACSQGGLTGLCSGTSMAAPHVAAVAALVRARYPAWSNTDVRNRLRNTALPLGSASDFGAGLVQALAAVQ